MAALRPRVKEFALVAVGFWLLRLLVCAAFALSCPLTLVAGKGCRHLLPCDGELYDTAPPDRRHQKIAFGLGRGLADCIDVYGGPCEAYVAPFAVNISADDANWVEPDVLVVCDPSKLSDRGCESAPDFVAEVVSPSSRKRDYLLKLSLYEEAGVREYWVVDPQLARTTVYRFDVAGPVPVVYPFNVPVPVGIFGGELKMCVEDLL